MAGDHHLTEDEEFAALRHEMVEDQLRARGIEDEAILAAFRKVPRHEFVDPGRRMEAYADRALPLAEGQTISQPFVVARMAELARLRPGDRVLEVGAGSGYAAAIFAEIAAEVTTVEIRPALAERAREALDRLGYDNVTVVAGDADELPADARFDAVIAAAAAPRIPASLERQLTDGGRMVLPVGTRFSQYLWTVERRGDEFVRRRHEPVAFVPLI
ncbi:MAG TPA: protein-L-isoaspartate(D-aspartate) O-methyltransferase [Acidimicrobiia bacterium]|nr:protein-L-isoaspartate(D-aspartate) O-methyltransferase [Acidimicrobiia bacterium]